MNLIIIITFQARFMGHVLHKAGEDGWVYDVYTKDTPVGELGRYGKFKELWDSKRSGAALPAWRDYELLDFADWYGWISVEDVIPGPDYDSVFRLWGTELTKFYGRDLTNKRMRDYETEIFSKDDFNVLMAMIGTHHFRICSGPRDWQCQNTRKHSIASGFIELPLADDGQTVDRYINMAVPIKPEMNF